MVLPMQVGDPRLTTDRWHEVGQEQRAAEEARQKREAIEADRARREFYSRPVTWPLSFTSLAQANTALESAAHGQVRKREALALLGGEDRYFEAAAPSGSPRLPVVCISSVRITSIA